MNASKDLTQRRLAGSVVTDERHDLARVHIQIDTSQADSALKCLKMPCRLSTSSRSSYSLCQYHDDRPGAVGSGRHPSTSLTRPSSGSRLHSTYIAFGSAPST
jgi:hypothetical protein